MRLSYLFNFLAAVAVVGVLIFGTADSRAAFKLMGASGAVSLSNSREGAAILNGAGLRPGARSSGSVTIGNPGSSETRLALDVTSEGETAGTGGARIWDTLRISISDGSRVVYEGRVADLGRLDARRARRGRPADLYRDGHAPVGPERQRAPGRAALAALHVARASPPRRPPSRRRTRPSRPSARRSRRPTTDHQRRPERDGHGREADLDAGREEVREPTLTAKFTPPAGVKVKSVATTVNGKKGASAKNAKPLALRALPKKGAIKVSVTATLSTGRKVTLKRTYKACGK